MAQAATILRTILKDRNKLTVELKTNYTENNQDDADKITAWSISRWLSELTGLLLQGAPLLL